MIELYIITTAVLAVVIEWLVETAEQNSWISSSRIIGTVEQLE